MDSLKPLSLQVLGMTLAGIGQVREHPGDVCPYSLSCFVPVFQAAVPDWVLFIFPTRSLCWDIDPLPAGRSEHSDLVLQPGSKGRLNCSGWFQKQEISAAWVTGHGWRCRLLVSQTHPRAPEPLVCLNSPSPVPVG